MSGKQASKSLTSFFLAALQVLMSSVYPSICLTVLKILSVPLSVPLSVHMKKSHLLAHSNLSTQLKAQSSRLGGVFLLMLHTSYKL